jgi:hypothetical protein
MSAWGPSRPCLKDSCPQCPVCGRLRVGKSFLHVADWSVQPCVRPTSAVHMTAGHNVLRGSGPDRKPAFENASGQVGCPDRRIDRLCITCCWPSQPSHHVGCPTRSATPQARRVPCSPTCAVRGGFLCFHKKRRESDQWFRQRARLIWPCSADLGYFLWLWVWF